MTEPLWTDSDWTFPLLSKTYEEIEKIGVGELGLNLYPNQFEIINSEQMLELYTNIAMPTYYSHWSFGKRHAQDEQNYKSGASGLAYEIVNNLSPTINYLMEDNSMTTQALVMAHAACVSGDTEYLSTTGWKKIADYKIGDLVAQYNEDGTANFINPTHFIKKPVSDPFIHVEGIGVDQLITPDHTVVFENHLGSLIKITGEELNRRNTLKTRGFNGKFITGFQLKTHTSLPLTNDEIMLHIAIKADGSYPKKIISDHFNCVSHHRVRFHLKKQRKIERLEEILTRLNISFDKNPSYDGRVFISFNIKEKIEKRFDVEWYSASSDQLKLIGNEVLLWDGSVSSNKFSSKFLEDINYIQYVWASTGKHTHVSQGVRCFEVNFSIKPRKSISKHGEDNAKKSPKIFDMIPSDDGYAYCFTVPSGMFISRRNNKITVTGNCGHNFFFKNNYLFKTWTDAEAILDYLVFAKDYITKVEEIEGRETVETFLDSCHALMDYGVNRYKRPSKLSMENEKKKQRDREEYLQSQVDEMYRILPTSKTISKKLEQFPKQPEENILYFCEKYAPSLKTWERELIRIVRKISQYFYPQAQTKIANEGCATYTHYTIMNRLHQKGLTSHGAHMEFLALHSNVLTQPTWDKPYYNGMNPYKLGFEIFKDIDRICTHPTDEDKKWFPDLIGENSWDIIKDAVVNYRDESFIRQFLSPKLIRDLRLFQVKDVREHDAYIVEAIHDERGYDQIRTLLADQNEREIYVPRIEVVKADPEDRSLTLLYTPLRNRKLADPTRMLQHVKRLWGYKVRLMDKNGTIKTI
jgi:spore cortex formation protein SpoVR/YcgB (stage V sporulation)